MKTEFELDAPHYFSKVEARIIGTAPKWKPYVAICLTRHGFNSDDKTAPSVNWKDTAVHIKDKDLERFAVNILKALKSKHLKK